MMMSNQTYMSIEILENQILPATNIHIIFSCCKGYLHGNKNKDSLYCYMYNIETRHILI